MTLTKEQGRREGRRLARMWERFYNYRVFHALKWRGAATAAGLCVRTGLDREGISGALERLIIGGYLFAFSDDFGRVKYAVAKDLTGAREKALELTRAV